MPRLFIVSMALFFLFSCSPEPQDLILPITEEPEELPQQLPINTFALTVFNVGLEHGYIHSAPDTDGRTRHHIILSADVVHEGNLLTGQDRALSLVLFSEGTDIVGAYHTGERAEPLRYFSELTFTTTFNRPNLEMESGVITVSRNDAQYVIEIDFYDGPSEEPTRVAKGKFQGDLLPVFPRILPPPAGDAFDSSVAWTVAGHTPDFQYAYLRTNGAQKILYLTEQNVLSAEGELVGVSDMLAINISSHITNSTAGFYVNSTYDPDFLDGEPEVGRRLPGNFCTEYDFQTEAYANDYGTETETLLSYDGEQLRLRLRGSEGQTIAGVYQGPLTIID